MSLRLDHFISGGRDLDAMIADFTRRTGVAPGRGGRHPGLGTHNALVSLGSDVYFELLAVDPTQRASRAGTMGGRIDAFEAPRLFAYMVKSEGLERQRDVLARHGIGADLFDASRDTPDGRTLRWRLLVPHDNPFGDFVPKFIDWLDTVHPATTSTPGCAFERFDLGHPQALRLDELLRELDAGVWVEQADAPRMRLSMQTPRGRVEFTG
jgi:hypothetical protein